MRCIQVAELIMILTGIIDTICLSPLGPQIRTWAFYWALYCMGPPVCGPSSTWVLQYVGPKVRVSSSTWALQSVGPRVRAWNSCTTVSHVVVLIFTSTRDLLRVDISLRQLPIYMCCTEAWSIHTV